MRAETVEEIDNMLNNIKNGKGIMHVNSKITKGTIKAFLPKGSAVTVTDDMIEVIGNMGKDIGVMQGYIEERFLSNLQDAATHGVPIPDYTKAIKFVALCENMSRTKAWAILHPKQYTKYRNTPGKEHFVGSMASSYARGALVTKLFQNATLAPSILYAPANTAAMNRLIGLVDGKSANPDVKVSPTVQKDAAIAILDYTKMPDTVIEQTNSNDEEGKGIQTRLAEQLAKMALTQLEKLNAGEDLDEVQKLGIAFDVDVVDEKD